MTAVSFPDHLQHLTGTDPAADETEPADSDHDRAEAGSNVD
ncbi:hypothetical protein [Rhodococcus opacus]|nr:hypothetical protein [Rhodococcus opacus]